MRTDLYLPPEVWHGHVLQHTVNDVYNLQRLRAVNKGFRETMDARVMAIVQTIQQHESRCTPPDVNVHVSESDIETTEKARVTGADWVLLACVAEKRSRAKKNGPPPSIADVYGKTFLHYITATLCGKMSLTATHPQKLRGLTEAMCLRYSQNCMVCIRDEWIALMIKKLAQGLPSDVTTVWMKTMLEHALYVVNQPRTCAKMRTEQMKRRRASALSVMGADSPSMVIADFQTPRIQCKDVDGEGSVALGWN